MTPEAGSVPPEALKEPHLGLLAPEPREDTVLVSGNGSHLPAPHLKTKSEGTKPALPLRGHPVSSRGLPAARCRPLR